MKEYQKPMVELVKFTTLEAITGDLELPDPGIGVGPSGELGDEE